MDIFFEVKQSPIHGLGLFCKKTVKKNTVFHIETSRPTKQNITHKKDTYILDYYVNPYAYYEGKCVIGHKITSYRNIWTSLHSSVFNEMYVTSKDISMRSNDLVWPSVSEIEYNKQIDSKNHLEMLLVLSEGYNKKIEGVAIRVIKDIYPGEECGNTYGYNFWVEE